MTYLVDLMNKQYYLREGKPRFGGKNTVIYTVWTVAMNLRKMATQMRWPFLLILVFQFN